MRALNLFPIVIVLPSIFYFAKGDDHPVVNIPNLGTVRGKTDHTLPTNNTFIKFVDVPYGRLAVNGRYKAAIPVLPWSNIKDTAWARNPCPQLSRLGSSISPEDEECLTLTINTRNLGGSQPVIVYIHGDYLNEGDNNEATPGYLLEKDIVLVSPKYRLGPFGFLSTGTTDIPGNAGVSDILLALEWVQLYISSFGGDKHRVTVAGQYGSAAMVHALTLSNAVPRDLFHHIILQSGSVLTPQFVNTPASRNQALDIATFANCSDRANKRDINKCLIEKDYKTILEAYKMHIEKARQEGVLNYQGAFLTVGGPSGILMEEPRNIIERSEMHDYPIMAGTAKNVGSKFIYDWLKDEYNLVLPNGHEHGGEPLIESVIARCMTVNDTHYWTNFSKYALFPEDIFANGSLSALLPGLIDLAGDINCKSPIYAALQYNSRKQPENTFLYSFEYEGQVGQRAATNSPMKFGVTLNAEKFYLFPSSNSEMLNEADQKISNIMVNLWTSFAEFGVPKSKGVKWHPMKKITGPYLQIDKTCEPGTNYIDEFSATIKDEQRGKSLRN